MENINRYLAIVQWARKRYTANNRLVLSTGGNPSPYSRIENLAAIRLLGAMGHWQAGASVAGKGRQVHPWPVKAGRCIRGR